MAKKEYLKGENEPLLILFIIWCLAIYIAFLSSPSGSWVRLVSIFRDLRAGDGAVMVLSPIAALVLTGLISSGNKARLVFWRLRYALPGHRAFSKLAVSDSRIDMKLLLRKMGSLPHEPKEQNARWYSIYRRYSEATIVKEAHRAFLLARDLCSVSFLFAVFAPWSLLFFQHTRKWALLYFLIMVLHYFVIAFVAQNHGNRFVCNVIAEYLSDNSA